MHDELTTKSYWDSTYIERSTIVPAEVDSWRNVCTKKIYNLKRKCGLDRGPVLEIGGGASAWLAFLVKKYPNTSFSCLDFSEEGLSSLAAWKGSQGVTNLEIVLGDFFSSHQKLGKFDFVYSHGVVEHFTDLSQVLVAHSDYLSSSGKMLTVIPNMSGVLGLMTKYMNKEVYEIHVPHNLDSFIKGHVNAGLNVIEANYLCSNNFGVLSSCVRDKKGFMWHFHKMMSRFSKATWFFEDKVAGLPVSRFFSPYIYVISERLNERT